MTLATREFLLLPITKKSRATAKAGCFMESGSQQRPSPASLTPSVLFSRASLAGPLPCSWPFLSMQKGDYEDQPDLLSIHAGPQEARGRACPTEQKKAQEGRPRALEICSIYTRSAGVQNLDTNRQGLTTDPLWDEEVSEPGFLPGGCE